MKEKYYWGKVNTSKLFSKVNTIIESENKKIKT